MKTRDLRIESIRPLLSPAILLEELPLSEAGSIMVSQTRDQIVRIKVETPVKLNRRQKELLREFQELSDTKTHPLHRRFLDSLKRFQQS